MGDEHDMVNFDDGEHDLADGVYGDNDKKCGTPSQQQ